MGCQLGSFTQGYAVTAIFINDFLKLSTDIINGLIPGRLSPISRSPFTNPDKGGL